MISVWKMVCFKTQRLSQQQAIPQVMVIALPWKYSHCRPAPFSSALLHHQYKKSGLVRFLLGWGMQKTHWKLKVILVVWSCDKCSTFIGHVRIIWQVWWCNTPIPIGHTRHLAGQQKPGDGGSPVCWWCNIPIQCHTRTWPSRRLPDISPVCWWCNIPIQCHTRPCMAFEEATI